MFTDDAVIHGPAPVGVLPWGGIHNGRKGAAEFVMAVGESLEPQHDFAEALFLFLSRSYLIQ